MHFELLLPNESRNIPWPAVIHHEVDDWPVFWGKRWFWDTCFFRTGCLITICPLSNISTSQKRGSYLKNDLLVNICKLRKVPIWMKIMLLCSLMVRMDWLDQSHFNRINISVFLCLITVSCVCTKLAKMDALKDAPWEMGKCWMRPSDSFLRRIHVRLEAASDATRGCQRSESAGMRRNVTLNWHCHWHSPRLAQWPHLAHILKIASAASSS